jgi:hypothetical protein
MNTEITIKQLSKLEIIEETIKFYSEDINRRALVGDLCAYNTEDGKHCAVGRCFTEDVKKQGINFEFNTGRGVESFDFQSLLQEQYKGHETYFWRQLQQLHDSIGSVYWDENGITESGKQKAERIKEHFNLI